MVSSYKTITVQGEATINKPLEEEIIVFSIILKITSHLEKVGLDISYTSYWPTA